MNISLYNDILLRGSSAFIPFVCLELEAELVCVLSSCQYFVTAKEDCALHVLFLKKKSLVPISFIANEQAAGFQTCGIRKDLAQMLAIKFSICMFVRGLLIRSSLAAGQLFYLL